MSKRNSLVYHFWGHFFCIVTLVGTLSGCSIPFLKAKEPKEAIGSAMKYDPKSGKITQAGLQAEVMDFADQYVLLLWQALDEVIKAGIDPGTRATINQARIFSSAAAYSIAAGRNPAANFLDMVVFISLGRMAVEDYWVPKFFGAKGQNLLAAYRKLEKEIWDMAGQMLSPDQQEQLRNVIRDWRVKNPQQYYISRVRLSKFAYLRGASPVDIENSARGLLADVEKAMVKADEAFLLAERAMFLMERFPRILTMATEVIMDQTTANPGVQRLTNDVDKAVDSFASLTKTVQDLPKLLSAERQATIKQLGDWADTGRQQLWADLEREDPRLEGILMEIRQTLLAGVELTKGVAALTSQYKPNPQAPKSPHVTPVDYVKALQQATETVKETTILVKSMDNFIIGETPEDANLVKVFRHLNAETKAILNHAFWLALILVLVFLIGLVAALITYRYFTRRLV